MSGVEEKIAVVHEMARRLKLQVTDIDVGTAVAFGPPVVAEAWFTVEERFRISADAKDFYVRDFDSQLPNVKIDSSDQVIAYIKTHLVKQTVS